MKSENTTITIFSENLHKNIPKSFGNARNSYLKFSVFREQSLFMTVTGAEEIWEEVWKNTVSKKFLILERGSGIFCVLQSPKNPRGGTQP